MFNLESFTQNTKTYKDEFKKEHILELKEEDIYVYKNEKIRIELSEILIEETILGQKNLFKNGNLELSIYFRIKDKDIHYVCKNISKNDIDYIEEIINRLLKCEYIGELAYVVGLINKNFKENDLIKVDNKIGIIAPYSDEYKYERITNLRYIPLKKDGSLSKVKPRLIYTDNIIKL